MEKENLNYIKYTKHKMYAETKKWQGLPIVLHLLLKKKKKSFSVHFAFKETKSYKFNFYLNPGKILFIFLNITNILAVNVLEVMF